MISPKYVTQSYWHRLATDRTALNSVHKAGSKGKGREKHSCRIWITGLSAQPVISPSPFQNVLCVKGIELHSHMVACKSGKTECWGLLSSGLISVPFLDQ